MVLQTGPGEPGTSGTNNTPPEEKLNAPSSDEETKRKNEEEDSDHGSDSDHDQDGKLKEKPHGPEKQPDQATENGEKSGRPDSPTDQDLLDAEAHARAQQEDEANKSTPLANTSTSDTEKTDNNTTPPGDLSSNIPGNKPSKRKKSGGSKSGSPPAKRKEKPTATPGVPVSIGTENGDPNYTKPRPDTYLGFQDQRDGNIYRIKVSRIGRDKSVKAYLLHDGHRYLFHPNDLRHDPRVDVLTAEEAERREQERQTREAARARRKEAAKEKEAAESAAARAEAQRVADENQEWIDAFSFASPPQHNRHYNRGGTSAHHTATRRERVNQTTPNTHARSERPDPKTPSPTARRERTNQNTTPPRKRSRKNHTGNNTGQSDASPSDDDNSPTTSDKLRLARAEARKTELELQLATHQNTTAVQNKAILHLLENSNNLTEDQEDRKKDKPIVIASHKTTIPAMEDDNHHKLTDGRFLPIPTDFPYAQAKVPKTFEPVRTNYPFESFGMNITKLSGVHKCHNRQHIDLQLKTYTDSNLKKVDTPRAWNSTRSGEFVQKPFEKDIRDVQDATLALFNFFTINHLICPFNSESLQLFSAVYRSQISGYPGINAADVAELFTQWLLLRNANLASGTVIPYTWYEEKINQITQKRKINLADADLDYRNAAARIAKYSNESDNNRRTGRRNNNNTTRTPNRNRATNKPATKPKPPTRSGPPATPQNPSTARGQHIPCRDYNREGGCPRNVTAGTCASKDMVLVHRCNHRMPNGKFCLEAHTSKEHK